MKQAATSVQPLAIGPLQATLENGELRHIQFGGMEIIRGVYAAVRDPSWLTVEPTFSKYDVRPGRDHTRIELEAQCTREGDGIDFSWRAEITLSSTGVISYLFSGVANHPFAKARIGLCVLHPLRLAGTRVMVQTPWGTTRGEFPLLPTAHLPFSNITSVRQEPGRATEVEIIFEGDLFQMEDQRAFGDPSFKTFSTPLELPWPVTVEQGTVIEQAVHIRPMRPATLGSTWRRRAATSEIVMSPERVRGPDLGSQMPPAEVVLERREMMAARRLGLKELRIVLLPDHDFNEELRRTVHVAEALHCDIELALVAVPGTESIARAVEACRDHRAPLARVTAFHAERHTTSHSLVEEVRSALEATGQSAAVGAGSRAYLYQLLLNGAPSDVDYVSFALNPQVHASDDRSIMNSVEAIGAMVSAAGGLAAGKPVHVAPLSTRALFNPDLVDDSADDGPLPARYDARQPDLLTASWTLTAIAQLASSGASLITAHELAGWAGLVGAQHGSLPTPGLRGVMFPVGEVVAAISELRNAAWGFATRPDRYTALSLQAGRNARVLLSSRDRAFAEVRLRFPTGRHYRGIRVRHLSGAPGGGWLSVDAIERAVRNVMVVPLPASGVTCVDLLAS